MAAKVKIQDITDAGFRPEQFGTPTDWADEDGFLDRLIDRAETWSSGTFGAGYAAVPEASLTFERLRQAELCWVSAQLWKSRAAFIDSNASGSREAPAYLERREYLASAAQAFECANDNLAKAIGGEGAVAGTGASLGHVETGQFAPARGAACSAS